MSSSLTSKFSTLTGRTNASGTLTTTTRKPPTEANNDIESIQFALETFINNLQLQTFFELTKNEQNERLTKIDVLELFRVVQNINRELGMLQLENYFLIDFLQKNDSKLLIGLEERRKTPISFQGGSVLRSTGKSATSMAMRSVGSHVVTRTKSVASKSMKDSLSTKSQMKMAYEYKLNFRAKAEIAEKLANEIEKRVQEMERNASHEIKLLRGHMEEMNILQIETQETAANFELHFLSDEHDLAFLNSATEKQLESKFRKFVNNWIKNARALLATMRLKITAIGEQCQNLRNELITKADLSGILTAIDFEKLIIKRAELLNALEEKNVHMAGLKGVMGKAALSMAEEKQLMISVEKESSQLNNKTIEVVKTISKLEKEAAMVDKDNEKDILVLENLRTQLEHFEAPSINEYIDKKDEVLALEKEEKMLRRKIYILNMKLNNTQKKCKRNTDQKIFINMIE